MDLSSFLAATIRMAIPLLIAALGLVVSERAGLINIGVEGTMLTGAFAAFAVAYYTNNYWLGMLAGMLAGCFMTLIFAVASIRFKAPQVVIGCAINMLGSGFTAVLFRKMFFDAQTGGIIDPETGAIRSSVTGQFSGMNNRYIEVTYCGVTY